MALTRTDASSSTTITRKTALLVMALVAAFFSFHGLASEQQQQPQLLRRVPHFKLESLQDVAASAPTLSPPTMVPSEPANTTASPLPSSSVVTTSSPPLPPSPRTWTLDQIGRCFERAQLATGSNRVLVFSFGDSHGRQMIESLLLRTAPDALALGQEPNHRRFHHDITVNTIHFAVGQEFLGRPSKFALPTTLPPQTHVLLSRGTWDILYYATPLSIMYAEVAELLETTVADDNVVSVTWRLPHIFPELQSSHQRGCATPTSLDAVRRIGACAVSEFNRPNHRGTRSRRVSVMLIDPQPLVSELQLAEDGQHVGMKNSGAFMDMMLAHQVCPTEIKTLPRRTHKRVFATSDPASISHRYNCSELWALLKHPSSIRTQPSSGDLNAVQTMKLPLERRFGLGTRYGCRCTDPHNNLNDQCGIGFEALFPRRQRYNEVPVTFMFYVCQLRNAFRNPSPRLHNSITNLSSILVLPPKDQAAEVKAATWLAEIVLEICGQSKLTLPAFVNAGYVPNDFDEGVMLTEGMKHVGLCHTSLATGSSWCKALSSRLEPVVADINAMWSVFASVLPNRSAEEVSSTPLSQSLLRVKAPIGSCFLPSNPISQFMGFAVPLVCNANWTRADASHTPQERRSVAAERLQVVQFRKKNFPPSNPYVRAAFRELTRSLQREA